MTWFQDGVRFECTQCGACCRGPGYTLVSLEEQKVLAAHLNISLEQFREYYTTLVEGGRRILKDSPHGEYCTFLDSETNQCSVHEARPQQCRTFPFWRHHFESEGNWGLLGQQCEGVGRGQLFTEEDILRRLKEAPRGASALPES